MPPPTRARIAASLALAITPILLLPPAIAHDPNLDGVPQPTVSNLDWISGDWVSTNPDQQFTITETWSSPFHDTMTGIARTLVDGRLASTRAISITARDDGLPVLRIRRLAADLQDFPGFDASFYPLTSWTEDSLTFDSRFENHPRRVVFQRAGDDAMRITYVGIGGDNKLHTQIIDFRARNVTSPDHPNIARAQLFRALLDAEDYATARTLATGDPRRWWGEREGDGSPWTVGPPSGPWHAWDEHFHSRTEAVHWSATDDSASLTFREINDYFRLLERGWTTARITYFFDDQGLITGTLIEAVGPRPLARTEEFFAWAFEHYPDEIRALMPKPDGEVDPSGDHPQRMQRLLRVWRRETGLPRID